MLPNQSTTIISELKNYFSSNEKSIQTLFTELRSLKISGKVFRGVDKNNNRYSGLQKLILLILFPLFDIKVSQKSKQPLFFGGSLLLLRQALY